MPDWRLFLFGPPRLERDGRGFSLPRRKTLALLAYLAMTGQAHSRPVLTSLLWPEVEPGRAAGYLRRSLYELGQVLGEGVVVADREVAELAEGAVWLDVAEFQAQVQACRAAGWGCEAHTGPLTWAAELYAGDFLAGFSLPDAPEFDEWVFFQAEGLRRDLAQVLEALARCLAETGQPEAAVPHARRWLALDALNEAAHRALMRLYTLAGQPAAARRQFEELSRRLSDDLGVAPSTETTMLLARITAGELAPASLGGAERWPAAPGRPAEAAEARGPARASARLPSYLTILVGRERELSEVNAMLSRPEIRLLSLLGAGGIGKTRLAVEVARELHDTFKDGAHFVPLAPLTDPATLAPAIAQAIDVPLAGAGLPAEQLEEALRPRALLLVLDNFEQLLSEPPTSRKDGTEGAAAFVARLLAGAPGLKILVTSRALLGLRGEQQFLVPTLALPAPDQETATVGDLSAVPAVRLFVERAQAARPDFALTGENAAAVAAICRRLDGLPLAIELAAARIPVLAPPALLVRLERALPLLTGGARDAPERQQTLRRTIAWSHQLLDPAEQVFFRRLAVFSGGFDLEAAAAMAADTQLEVEERPPAGSLEVLDRLSRLVNQSLVVAQTAQGEPRFRLLETIREFALEQLEAHGEAEGLRRRHAKHYVHRVRAMGWVPRGPQASAWLDRLEAEHDNLRAALRWALRAGEVNMAARLAGHLEALWEMRGYGAEGLHWFEAVLEAGGERLAPKMRAWALWGAVRMALHRHDLERTARYTQQLVALREHLSSPGDVFTLLHSEASLARQQGDWPRAVVLYDQLLAVARASWPDDIPWGLHDRAEVAQLMGDTALAEQLYTESLAGFRASQEWIGVAWSLHNQAYLALRRGALVQARQLWAESLNLFRQLGARDGTASALAGLAAAAHAAGDNMTAARYWGTADAILDEAGMQFATVARAETVHYREAVRQALGDEPFQAAYAVGRRERLPES
jgi:predicted ATPase/DNA-binding SARP family transcriptional activator